MNPEEKKLKSEEVKAKFQEYYDKWIEFTRKPEVMLSSRPSDYTETEAYENIVKLGRPAVRHIIEKMEEGQLFLNDAMEKVVGIKLTKASKVPEDKVKFLSEQEKSKHWIKWWKKQKGEHRYLGNQNTTEVHDLWNETKRCQIIKIKDAGHDVTFDPDTTEEAHKQRYDNCAFCIGESKR